MKTLKDILVSVLLLLICITIVCLSRSMMDIKSFVENLENNTEPVQVVIVGDTSKPERNRLLVEMNIPTGIDTSFKSYMDYRKITNENSIQYQLQQIAETDSMGFRKIGDKYLVALGTYYTNICGAEFEIEFADNSIINVIVGDIKQDVHTDETNRFVKMDNGLGNVLEFIVDTNEIPNSIKTAGTISSELFKGNITSIKRVIYI